MTVIDTSIRTEPQAEQELGVAILAEGMRLASERDAERKAHEVTRHRLVLAHAEIRRLAVLVETLERQIDRAQQAPVIPRRDVRSRYSTQL